MWMQSENLTCEGEKREDPKRVFPKILLSVKVIIVQDWDAEDNLSD
jgi:hypothetical protein